MDAEMEYTVKIRVRYGETDQMGIVYHPNYYVWFELARTELLREIGISYHQIEERGFLIPVIETHCRHLQAAHYDEVITVGVEPGESKGIRFSFRYVARRGEETLATGETWHTFINGEGRPVRLQRKAPDIYNKLSEAGIL
ncbi:MAG: thioesterase family protein [Halanaerobium sp.]|nr:thioesterase family protein [Halanaerobium sp.]